MTPRTSAASNGSGPMRIGTAEAVFSISLLAVVYTYVLYPVLLFVLASVKQVASDLLFLLHRQNRRPSPEKDFLPRVAILCSAYNEEAVIEEKLRNTTQLDYPAEQLEILVGLDAPTDSTAQCLHRVSHPSFRAFPFQVRRGKLAVINDLVKETSAEILIFSD